MHLIVDFAQRVPQYNPNARPNSPEDRQYWDWHDKKRAQLEKKYKTSSVETQFEGDKPIFLVKHDKSGHNYIHDSQGKLKEKVKQNLRKEKPKKLPWWSRMF